MTGYRWEGGGGGGGGGGLRIYPSIDVCTSEGGASRCCVEKYLL